MKTQKLTPKQQAFVDEYLVDLCAAAAARRAGYSERTAVCQAARLLSKANVQASIASAMKARGERTRMTADHVLQLAEAMLMADVNALISYQHRCCRHCWGVGHAYQWKNERELSAARQAHARACAAAKKAKVPPDAYPAPPDESGGLGFDPRRAPHPECPECFGEGIQHEVVADTRNLPPAVRALYTGLKRTKEGFEIKTQSKDKLLELMFRHHGLLNDKLELSRPKVRVKDMTGRKPKGEKE
ncbi:terminase small subunit [Burkholderia gladioli]|uniref:terminase small subunit n=1 Tax=Burkholderia gladioli TaxID=28095 RepID=UPI001C2721FA|nr:terminase small subunit [Burkholderia gladioli]MBU9378718.1 terminase small subunit [Burkholderia gladioli]